MPRAPNDRPSRRLDAFLVSLRRHGVKTFEAAELEGVGKGLKFRFGELPAEPAKRPAPGSIVLTGGAPDPDLAERPANGKPIDELALVAAGLDGPVPEERTERGDA